MDLDKHLLVGFGLKTILADDTDPTRLGLKNDAHFVYSQVTQ